MRERETERERQRDRDRERMGGGGRREKTEFKTREMDRFNTHRWGFGRDVERGTDGEQPRMIIRKILKEGERE